ncbi:MAG: segregation/condensation protein A [Candidatus Ranarchaeia archaeon]
MTEKGYIDFSASGIALLSSSIIYRLKSELILELQEPPTPPPEKPMEFLPPPLQLPYRFEYTSTTIKHLITALEEMLKEETTTQTQPQPTPFIPDPFILRELDDFMINIENKLNEIYLKVLSLLQENDVLGFSKLVHGLKKIEKIRTFLLILFLATREKILLQQTEELGEIYISLPIGA